MQKYFQNTITITITHSYIHTHTVERSTLLNRVLYAETELTRVLENNQYQDPLNNSNLLILNILMN